LREAVFDVERLRGLLEDGVIAATDLADYLAVEHRIPFRTAHMIVGSLVRISVEEKRAFREVILKDLSKTVKELVGREISVPQNDVDRILDSKRSVESRSAVGGPSKVTVMEMIKTRRKGVKEMTDWISNRRGRLKEAESELKTTVEELAGGETS
ncbi:MAG: hypothetical protein ACE5KU_02875, partial [Nitrososphaerales archaeon]